MQNPNEDNLTEQQPSSTETIDQVVIPVLEEHATISTEVRETGCVRVSKSVTHQKQLVETPVRIEEIEIKRVPINRPIQEPVAAREEGSVTIVPVMEEVVVVTKQLMLREEIHLIRRTRETIESQEIMLEKDDIQVERF